MDIINEIEEATKIYEAKKYVPEKDVEEQILKKIENWNRTKQVKVHQAKRYITTNEKIEFRMMILFILVMISAVVSLSLGNAFLHVFALTFAIGAIYLQNYINNLQLGEFIRNLKTLEVNLYMLINDLEKLYRRKHIDKYADEYELNIYIQTLTDRYNNYLKDIPMHNNQDYNNYLVINSSDEGMLQTSDDECYGFDATYNNLLNLLFALNIVAIFVILTSLVLYIMG
ncbi:hypothetical protein R2F61_00880 [Mollicutes bacterium LVI A0078]|nr:hypothetical protein RZE84_00880 [Mollicutes bacterium LVI A0075]WOO91134.1 hypothetical protein R2F61_00880 [Mollicutes bacterium LVI A0078]